VPPTLYRLSCPNERWILSDLPTLLRIERVRRGELLTGQQLLVRLAGVTCGFQ